MVAIDETERDISVDKCEEILRRIWVSYLIAKKEKNLNAMRSAYETWNKKYPLLKHHLGKNGTQKYGNRQGYMLDAITKLREEQSKIPKWTENSGSW